MANAVITHFRRSPFHFAGKGALARTRPDDIAAQVIAKLVADSGIDAADIEDLILGCTFPEAEQGLNLGRILGFMTHLPLSVAGTTVNRFCGSSMTSIHMAVGAIAAGAGDVFICAGVESMSRVPVPGFNPSPNPALYKEYPQAYISMGETAENLAKQYQIGRVAQEELAVTSHQRAAAAAKAGKFDDGAETGLRRQGLGHRRHLLAADRRRGSRSGNVRGLRQIAWLHAAGADQGDGRGRLRARDHGHRPGSGHP
jgi:acetyl-CoA acyltransferase